jgi:hypothetical protein
MLLEGHVYLGTLPRNRRSPRHYKVEALYGERLALRYGWFECKERGKRTPNDQWKWSPRGIEEFDRVEFEVIKDLGLSPKEGDRRADYSWSKAGSSLSPRKVAQHQVPVSDTDCGRDLEAYLRNQIETWPVMNPSTNWSLLSSLSDEETSGILRAIEIGIVQIDSYGRCFLPMIRSAGRRPTQPHPFVMSADGSIRVPWREYVTQVGALAELVIDYG